MLLMVLMVALVSGAVFTAAAGARRTSSVLDRFLATQGDFDLMVAVSRPRVASDPDQVLALAAELETVAGVESVTPAQAVFPWIREIDESAFVTGPDRRYLDVATSHAIDGRMPTADDVGTVALNETAARLLDVTVGDVLVIPTLSVDTAEKMWDGLVTDPASVEADGRELHLDVVGVYRPTASLEIDDTPTGVLSPDAGDVLGAAAASDALFYVRGDVDSMDADGAVGMLQEAVPDAWVYSYDPQDTITPIRSTFDDIATGLSLFALVALVAGLVALLQAVSRQVGQTNSVAFVANALGMRARSVAFGIAAPSVAATSAGVVLGAVIASALSPLFPFSVPRRAEVDPGIRIDWPVLLVGSALFVLTLTAWAVLAGWAHARADAHEASPTPSATGVGLRRALPIAAGIGCSRVLTHRRGHDAAKPWSAIAGVTLLVAGIVAITVFTTSQSATAQTPARFGWNWDSLPYVSFQNPMEVATTLAGDDRLSGVGVTNCGSARFDDAVEVTCALEAVSGSIALVQLQGRPPSSPDEVALGTVTMASHDVDVGDTISVTGDSGTIRRLSVVGTVVVPDEDAPGEGLVVTWDGLAKLAGVDQFDYLPNQQSIVLKYSPGADPEALEAVLAAEYPLNFQASDAHPVVPQSLSQMERVRPTLFALAAFLGLLGAIGLVHFVLLSASRGRREIAVLEAVGFVGRQSRSVLIYQALTVGLIGVLIGLPLGVFIGRWVWISAVDQMGIVTTPTVPWLVETLVIIGALIGSIAIALLLAWTPSRRRPAVVLRTE